MAPSSLLGNGNGNDACSTSKRGGEGELPPLRRAEEVEDLIDAVKELIIPYIRSADENVETPRKRDVLVDARNPEELVDLCSSSLVLPERDGRGKEGLLDVVADVLRYSVNTWDQGFLDKLYSSTNAVGVISEMLLAVLNTNVHIYHTSPSLTVVEKTTARALASLFGLVGPRAGGVTCQGGSSSNLTSLIIARNTLFPATKTDGNAGRRFAVFTSAHGHYSVEKSATTAGLGSRSVVTVPVDKEGRMIPSALEAAIKKAKERDGMTPLYVNATAGTTVLGSFDPLDEIADICKSNGVWFHVDASWGGGVVFSDRYGYKLKGAERADSVTVNPHKMINVPVTCSFLLTRDVSIFHRANTLPAGYLFHSDDDEDDEHEEEEEEERDKYWDLADLTLQCGRRGDSLKLALAWIYYGKAGFAAQVEHAFDMAAYLATLIQRESDRFVLLSSNPPPCLQVCFYHHHHHHQRRGAGEKDDDDVEEGNNNNNTRRTKTMVRKLKDRGFMVDYAPGDAGSFVRVVVNCQTRRSTVEGLATALCEIAKEEEEEEA
ncbi:glutamate decarboxylase [Xylariaceae sp. FL0594]|nr:glutamate decarboxylase [Xylariaceae sp. FL0594]